MDIVSYQNAAQMLNNFDNDLLEFYHKVVAKEFDLRKERDILLLQQNLGHVANAYRKESYGTEISDIRYDTAAKRCAYVLKYSTCFTSAATHHLLKFLRGNPDQVKKFFYHGKLNVCCLGGGPASDIISIIKIIMIAYNIFSIYKQQIELKIVIIDQDKDWAITAQNVMDILQNTPEFFDPKKIKLNWEFIKTDLSQPFKTDVQLALAKADIITMIYFLSAIRNDNSRMQKEIFKNMKEGALLFYMDIPVSSFYEGISSAAHTYEMNEIYSPHEHDCYRLSKDAVWKSITMYSENFEGNVCLHSCITTASIWNKISPEQETATAGYFKFDWQSLTQASDWQDYSNDSSDWSVRDWAANNSTDWLADNSNDWAVDNNTDWAFSDWAENNSTDWSTIEMRISSEESVSDSYFTDDEDEWPKLCG